MGIKNTLLLFVLIFSLAANLYGQDKYNYTGKVLNSEREVLSGVVVSLQTGSSKNSALTSENGVFSFNNVTSNKVVIQLSHIGYEVKEIEYTGNQPENNIDLGNIFLSEKSTLLESVVVFGQRKKVQIKQDTIQFNAEHFKLKAGSKTKDLIKSLPGAMLDNGGGLVIQGKTVSKVRVNGKDFLTGDLKTIGNSIPLELIDNVQIIQDYGDLANVTGNKNGASEQIININLKKYIINGFFAQTNFAVGTSNRFLADASATAQLKKIQISTSNTYNNTNLMTNLSSLGAAIDGTPGKNNSSLNAFNFRYDINKNLLVNANYIKNTNKSNLTESISRLSQYSDNEISSKETRESENKSNADRAGISIEYSAKRQFLKIASDFDFSTFTNIGTSEIKTVSDQLSTNIFNQNNSNMVTPKAGASLIYSYRFTKPGRTATVNYSYGHNKERTERFIINDGFTFTPVQNTKITNSGTTNLLGLNYTEPISKLVKFDMAISNSLSNNKSIVNTITSDLPPQSTPIDTLATDYLSRFSNSNISFSFRIVNKNFNGNIGINLNYSKLTGSTNSSQNFTKTDQFNFSPNLRLSFKFDENKIVSIDYTGTSSAPSVEQLLPLRDIQNVQNIIIGNPDLRPEFRNNIRFHFNKIVAVTGNSLFIGFDYNTVANKIIQTRNSDQNTLAQVTSYINASGYNSYRAYYSFTQTIGKTTIGLNGSFDVFKNISFLNGVKTTGQSTLISNQISLKTLFFKGWTNQIIVDYNLNTNKFSETAIMANRIGSFKTGLTGEISILKSSSFGYEIHKTFNSGYTLATVINPFIVNLYYELSLSKSRNLNLKLMAIDLLNQNTSINRNVFSNTITDIQSNRLTRYLLMSLSYNFKNINFKN